MNYYELAHSAHNELAAFAYADVNRYVNKTPEATELRGKMKERYLKSLESRNFSRNKVAVYAITKNEIKYVAKWYNSMKEADYIVVLDTGSTDGTYEAFKQIQKIDPRVIVHQQVFTPWRFDLPRNIAMSYIPTDANILLSTDLDEVLEAGWYLDLISNWNEGETERATYQYAWSHSEDGRPARVFWYNKVHSWKWIWRYPVHELLYNVVTEVENYPASSSTILNKMFLHHWPDRTKSRSTYLPLLEQRAAEDGADIYGLIYLAHEYNYRGLYEKSIEILNKVIARFDEFNDIVIKASCFLFKGEDYFKLGEYDNAIKAYNTAIEIAPLYREPYLGCADVYLQLQDYSSVINIVNKALKTSVRQYTWVERDISWTYQPYDLLCLAYYYSGEKLKSLACAYLALDKDKNNARLQDNVNKIIVNLDWQEGKYGI